MATPRFRKGLDVNGSTQGVILDDDRDTSISAPTDDQIDVEVAGADDFRFVANIFRALSGSVVQTDTIDETTAGSGVTIDGLQIKDSSVRPDAIADPGNAGAIPVTKSGYCPLVTAGAETRTLAAPDFIGQELLLYLKTDGGDCVVTCTTTINETGNNTITFDNTGEAISLLAVEEGANLRWRCAVADGARPTTV